MFCVKCGQKLPEGSKYCLNCGCTIGNTNENVQDKRKILYEGEVYKCPSCGEILDSFTKNCPSCGYEIRGNKVSNSLREFAEKLSQLDNAQKKDVIRNYPIPNTKEDVLEFSIFAASNIDENLNEDVFDAWVSKFNQAYEKGKILFRDCSEISIISRLNDDVNNIVRRRNEKVPKRIAFIAGGAFAYFFLGFITLVSMVIFVFIIIGVLLVIN